MTGLIVRSQEAKECSKHAVVSSFVDSTLRVERVDGVVLLSVTRKEVNAGR